MVEISSLIVTDVSCVGMCIKVKISLLEVGEILVEGRRGSFAEGECG